jgi:hypothetical protein
MIFEGHRIAMNKAYLRSVTAISMITVWGAMIMTGFLIYIAPTGPRSGRLPIFFLNKGQWVDLHFWIGLLAIFFTVMHVIIDWKALLGCLRYLASLERRPTPLEPVTRLLNK